MAVQHLITVKVSCSDLDRSAAFYAKLGFALAGEASTVEDGWLLRLYGVGAGLRMRSMTRQDDPRGVRLELLEWKSPAPRVADITAPGAGMLAFRSNDIRGDLAALAAAGGEAVSEPMSMTAPAGETLLVNVRDPDGYGVQLMQFIRAPTS